MQTSHWTKCICNGLALRCQTKFLIRPITITSKMNIYWPIPIWWPMYRASLIMLLHGISVQNLWLIYFNYSSGQKWCPEGDISSIKQSKYVENILCIFLNLLNMKEQQNFKNVFYKLNWIEIVYPKCKFCQF